MGHGSVGVPVGKLEHADRREQERRRERDELSELLAKVEPREFVGEAADRLSPVPLPKRLTHGRGRSG